MLHSHQRQSRHLDLARGLVRSSCDTQSDVIRGLICEHGSRGSRNCTAERKGRKEKFKNEATISDEIYSRDLRLTTHRIPTTGSLFVNDAICVTLNVTVSKKSSGHGGSRSLVFPSVTRLANGLMPVRRSLVREEAEPKSCRRRWTLSQEVPT